MGTETRSVRGMRRKRQNCGVAVKLLPEWAGATCGVFYYQIREIDKAKEVLESNFRGSNAAVLM